MDKTKWERWTGSNRCPNCGSNKIEYNTQVVLATYPPQSELRCRDCGHIFSSGLVSHVDHFTDSNVWEHDQSILGKPQVSDWPLTPQVGDWPPYNEPEPPTYPDISMPSKTSQVGWECPKCGAVMAPHVSCCVNCRGNKGDSTITTISTPFPMKAKEYYTEDELLLSDIYDKYRYAEKIILGGCKREILDLSFDPHKEIEEIKENRP